MEDRGDEEAMEEAGHQDQPLQAGLPLHLAVRPEGEDGLHLGLGHHDYGSRAWPSQCHKSKD